ncbi:MAG: DUF1924 domain-containing protein [Gammaproteobacteria bacterium]
MHTIKTSRRPLRPAMAVLLATLAAAYSTSVPAADTSPAQQASRWNTEAGSAGDALRGEQFFRSKHGKKWSCTSCHQDPPVKPGRHAATGKVIDPLAPAYNPKAFTDTKRIDKWFRRNCNDVLGRECTAQEKADVVAYLNGIRR